MTKLIFELAVKIKRVLGIAPDAHRITVESGGEEIGAATVVRDSEGVVVVDEGFNAGKIGKVED